MRTRGFAAVVFVLACVCLALPVLAGGRGGPARLRAAGPSGGEACLPEPELRPGAEAEWLLAPEGASSNIDFVSRAMYGASSLSSAWGHAVAYDALLKRAYIGFYSTLVVLSTVDKHHPAVLGWLDLDYQVVTSIVVPFPGSPDITVGTRSRVLIVNLSTPSAPAIVTSAPIRIREMAFSATQLLVASDTTLQFLDPASLAVVTSIDAGATVWDVAVLGDFAYLATEAGIQVVDIGMGGPFLRGYLPSPQAHGIAVQDLYGTLYAFVANNSGSPDLSVFDVTDPLMPFPVASVDLSAGGGIDIAVLGRTVYLAGTTGGLLVVDVTTPASPTLASSYTAVTAWGIALDGSDLYLNARRDGLQILDVTFSPPWLYGGFLSPGAYGIDVQGSYAYVCSTYSGLNVVDLSTLARPRIVGRLTSITPWRVQVVGATAYVTDITGQLHEVNVSNPTSPVLVRTIPLAAPSAGLCVRGGYAYVACDVAGLAVVRLSDGATFYLDTPYWAVDVEISGNYAYVADWYYVEPDPTYGQIVVVDISNPEAPTWAGEITTQLGPEGLEALGPYLYAATDWGLEIFNVSVPPSPYYVGGLPTGDFAGGVSVADGLAYVAAGYLGLRVVDVSSPWSPVEVGYYVTEPSATVPLYRDGYCYMAASLSGAYVFHYAGACYDRYEPNDDFERAWPISPGAFYDALICNAADGDYYALTIPAGGTITATLSPPSWVNYDLFLYDPSRSLVAYSIQGANIVDALAFTTPVSGTYDLVVNGSDATQYDATRNYRLVYNYAPCAAPAQPLLIYNARKDPNLDVILDILDPNQPATVTGYNIYRSTSPSAPWPWPLRAGNVVDMDHGTANTQYVDIGSNAGGPYYYIVRAVNAACGAEGP